MLFTFKLHHAIQNCIKFLQLYFKDDAHHHHHYHASVVLRAATITDPNCGRGFEITRIQVTIYRTITLVNHTHNQLY